MRWQEKRGVTLDAEGDGSLIGSDALIYRLLFNLTENAVKYNRPGGSVRVELAQGQEKCIIRVSDTGCIPEEYQRSIFHPFFRVDRSRSRESAAARDWGFSLVWEIASLHGGSVWVGEVSSDKGRLSQRWGCQRNNQRSPKTLLFVFRRFALPPVSVPRCTVRSAGKRSVPFHFKLPSLFRVAARQRLNGRVFAAVWQPLLQNGVVGAIWMKRVFLVKPSIYRWSFSCFVKPCSHKLSLLRPCYAMGIFRVFTSS